MIFEYFSVDQIMDVLCRVCKRWRIISETHSLWKIINIDEWMIDSVPELPFDTIMSHAVSFTYFSMRNVGLHHNSGASLCSLGSSKNLVYLDLSRQSQVTSIDFLGKNTPQIEYLYLEYCISLDPNSILECVKYLSSLKFFSINGLMLSQNNTRALISNFKLTSIFNLGLAGSHLSLESAEDLLDTCPRLLFLQMSCAMADEAVFKDLGRYYDVSISFPSLKYYN